MSRNEKRFADLYEEINSGAVAKKNGMYGTLGVVSPNKRFMT